MRRLPTGILIVVAAAGCSRTDDVMGPPAARSASPPPPPTVLRVAGASDLQGALPALVKRFCSGRPIEVAFLFGASGQLAQQIEQGAPYDVFLSANHEYVRELASKGLIDPESVHPYAEGVLVLVVNRASGAPVEGLADLARPEVKKVAIANPAVAPYGAAAREALERSGLAEAIGPRLVQAESVRQAMQFVETGNAEAGLVAHSVAGVPEVRVVQLDRRLHSPVIQALGVVTASANRATAEEFARFVLGDEGQEILASFGFRSARATGAR